MNCQVEPITIAIVGCGKAKLDHAAEARDMYTSTLFRAARRYAESCDDWVIVSALYGLLAPETVIEPYEYQLERSHRQQWGQSQANHIVYDHRDVGPYEVILLCGEDYAGPIVAGLRNDGDDGWRCNLVGVREPLKGMGLGKRMQWLTKEAT